MVEKSRYIRILKSVLFCMIGIVLFLKLQDILCVKFNYPVFNDGVTRTWTGFYECEKDTIDVIFLGTSHASSGISPMHMYETNKIVSYNLGTSEQPIEVSYWSLKEALEYQSPKVVVLDASNLFFGEKERSIGWKYVLDSIPMSRNKVAMAKEYMRVFDEKDLVGLLFPIFRYHDRWEELTLYDFRQNKASYTKGYMMRSLILGHQMTIEDMNVINNTLLNDEYEETVIIEQRVNEFYEKNPIRVNEISDHNIEYLQAIKNLCDEYEISFLLTKVPCVISPTNYASAWTEDRYQLIKKLCVELDVDFWDLTYDEQLIMNWKTDSIDAGKHLNIHGAERVTDEIGEYLTEYYALNSRIQEQYEEEIAYYRQLRKVALLQAENDFATYLTLLKDYSDELVIGMAVSDGFFVEMTEEEVEAIQALGLEVEIGNAANKSYIAVIESNEKKYEAVSNRKLSYNYEDEMNNVYKIVSASYINGATASININNESYAGGYYGLNIVVYDKECRQVIDSVRFIKGEETYTGMRDLSKTESSFRKIEEYIYSQEE